MSPAAEVLARARAAGVTLDRRGDRLAYDAPAEVPIEILDELRQHKADILLARSDLSHADRFAARRHVR